MRLSSCGNPHWFLIPQGGRRKWHTSGQMPAWGCPTSGGSQVQSHGAGAACSCKGPGSVCPRARCLLSIPFPSPASSPTPSYPPTPTTAPHNQAQAPKVQTTNIYSWATGVSSFPVEETPHTLFRPRPARTKPFPAPAPGCEYSEAITQSQ